MWVLIPSSWPSQAPQQQTQRHRATCLYLREDTPGSPGCQEQADSSIAVMLTPSAIFPTAQMWRQDHGFVIVREAYFVMMVFRFIHLRPFFPPVYHLFIATVTLYKDNPKSSVVHKNIHLLSSWAWRIQLIWVDSLPLQGLASCWLP